MVGWCKGRPAGGPGHCNPRSCDCGPEVRTASVAQRVTVAPRGPCHQCELCRNGMSTLCRKVTQRGGSWAEWIVAPAKLVHPLPDDVPLKIGALTEPLSAALRIIDRANLLAGMNVSGTSVRAAADFYRIEPADVLVVCDDMDLPVGKLRLRAQGSAGGQKGLADIIRHLGTDAVPRLRIGVGRPPDNWDPSDYVLSKFTKEENEEIQIQVQTAADAAADWVQHGIPFCMNKYN